MELSMAKNDSKVLSVPFPTTSCKAIAVTKTSSLLHQSFELTIVNGVVTSIKELSRTPDLPVIVIGNAETHLWNIRDQAPIDTTKNT
jgi:hypothetical protein